MRRLFCHAALLMATALPAAILHAAPASAAPATAAAAPVPPAMRLGDAIRPLSYDVDLTLVPERERFDGRIAIDIDIAREQDFYWINARNLVLSKATLAAAGKETGLAIVPGNDDFVGLRLPGKAARGKARLTIEFSGAFELSDSHGLFKQKDGEDWYAFSQFEALNARRAFPCFDEPHWKTPWTLALTIRREHTAVSNMPEVGSEDLGNGMKRVRFAPTAPLPSYLVALGVGPFEVIDGGVAGRNRTPLRYVTPRGRSAEAAYARKVTPDLLALLEDYFDRPYPFAKLDSMVIPVTVGFSAMENAGLITYNARTMLATPERDNERFQRRYASIAAHELAHQWFGDLVTMQWWTDIWLNESFATWMARKTIAKYKPEWNAEEYRIHERENAMSTDRLASSRQIRQPINVPDDLANAFDGITYSKGGAVLTMFERWLGESAFRDGVRRYINAHAFGNAAAEDFFRAMSALDPAVGRGFASFVEQPGVPKVDVALQCKGKPALTLTQQRYLPAKPAAAAGQSWTIPVCVRYAGQKADAPACRLLTERSTTWPLEDVTSCPDWVLANPGGSGYFLTTLDPSVLERLPVRNIGTSEAVALADDLQLLSESGAVAMEKVLALAERYAQDPRPELVEAAALAVAKTRIEWLSPEERTRFAHWIMRHFGTRARELGWLPREGEPEAVRSLRRTLLPLVARYGDDRALRTQAGDLAMRWLAGAERPPVGGMLEPILRTATYAGDRALFDALVAAISSSRDAGLRDQMFGALGSFEDPQLREAAYALTLSDRFDIRESTSILMTAAMVTRHAPSAIAFIRGHYDALVARLPEHYGAHFAHWGGSLCTPQDRAAFASFFGGRVAGLQGGARNLAQSLETIDICLASQPVQQARLKRYLAAEK